MASRFAKRPQPKGLFIVSADDRGDLTVLYKVSEERTQAALDAGGTTHPELAVMNLIEAFVEADRIVIYPHDTDPSPDRFLKPKYNRLRSIELSGFDFFPFGDVGEIESLIASLPRGFLKDPEYGLGLWSALDEVVAAIETIPGVGKLVIVRKGTSGIDGDTYRLTQKEFEALRLAVGRTRRHALREARIDKHILIHNTMLTSRDPERYPAKTRPYRRDTIFKIVSTTRLDADGVSAEDGRAASKVVAAAAGRLAEADPPALLALQREIELVTLEALATRIIAMLNGRPLPESAWQAFFTDNPFVLSLAFSLPIIAVGDRISVGGRTLDGSGDKVADFLYRNHLTDNVTVVEIKTPQDGLLGREYRGGVYPPSPHLAGAVSQLLDQRYQLQKNLVSLKDASRRYDLESYAIKGLLVAGRRPNDPDRRKALELFRNNLNDVQVVTYDELVEKLQHLRRVLGPEIAPPQPGGAGR